jgi:FKBP-type peptidyl-prolyl cis-trans isomerase
MRSKYLVLLMFGLLASGLTSCMKNVDNQDEVKITENDNDIVKYLSDTIKAVKQPAGYYFLTRKANALGDSAKTGDAATVFLQGYLLNGTKVTSDTVSFPVDGYTLLSGIELGIKKMFTGEKAVLFLPYYLAFGSTARTNIPAYSPVRMEMEFIKTRTEVQQIEDYIKAKKFTVTERTSDNLFIIRTDTTTGTPIGSGKSVSVKYIGHFLDGTKFDENTYTFTTNVGQSVKGFDQAVQKLPAKGKAIVVFPSPLGYGKTGNASIPPYTPLQFELEVQ